MSYPLSVFFVVPAVAFFDCLTVEQRLIFYCWTIFIG